MGNKNYINGRAKEYKIIKQKKEEGFNIAQRSAGSHSPVDVFAIDSKRKIIHLVQSKPKSMSNNKKEEIERLNNDLNGIFEVRFYVE